MVLLIFGSFLSLLSLGLVKKYQYEGIWRPDEDRHLDWVRRASLYKENGHFSIKNKVIKFSVYNSFVEN